MAAADDFYRRKKRVQHNPPEFYVLPVPQEQGFGLRSHLLPVHALPERLRCLPRRAPSISLSIPGMPAGAGWRALRTARTEVTVAACLAAPRLSCLVPAGTVTGDVRRQPRARDGWLGAFERATAPERHGRLHRPSGCTSSAIRSFLALLWFQSKLQVPHGDVASTSGWHAGCSTPAALAPASLLVLSALRVARGGAGGRSLELYR